MGGKIHHHPSEAQESLGLLAHSRCRTWEEHDEHDSWPSISLGAPQEVDSLVCVGGRETPGGGGALDARHSWSLPVTR